MVVQWNSSAAQEALVCLRRAERGLHECLKRAQTVRTALEEANPEGDNKQLNEVQERVNTCEKRLNALLRDVSAYKKGVQRADARFDEAEASLLRLVEELGNAGGVSVTGGTGGYVNWDPSMYAVTPDMRVRIAPMPSWLEDMAAESAAV